MVPQSNLRYLVAQPKTMSIFAVESLLTCAHVVGYSLHALGRRRVVVGPAEPVAAAALVLADGAFASDSVNSTLTLVDSSV